MNYKAIWNHGIAAPFGLAMTGRKGVIEKAKPEAISGACRAPGACPE